MELYPPSFVEGMRKLKCRFGAPRVVDFVTNESPRGQAFLARFEEWFFHIPSEHHKDLRRRLWCTNDGEFLGAYFEVVFHEFLLQRGYNLTIHPHIDQTRGRPDFLASNDNAFYLEVKTRFSSAEIAEKEREIDSFLRMIDSIPSPYFVIVQFYTWLPDGFDSERAKHTLATYLNSLSFEQPDEIIKYFYKEQGALIEYAMQKKPVTMELPTVANRGLPAMFSWGSDLIRSALFEKATRHRGIERLGLPFVIALCSSGDWMVNEKALDWALFGKEQVTFFPGHPERGLELHRDLSGLFSPTPGDPSGGNTWVSAVVFCQESGITSEGGYHYLMEVHHHPSAALPLPIEVFKGLPQLVKIGKTETEAGMEWIDEENKEILLQ